MKAVKTVLGVDLYTQEEAAQLLGISKATIAKYIKTGRMPARRIGRRYMLTQEDLKAFLHGQLKAQNV